MAKKRKDWKERSHAAGSAAVELTLDRVTKAAERSRGELEPALSAAIRLARAEIVECALILKHAESSADGGHSRQPTSASLMSSRSSTRFSISSMPRRCSTDE
jgi:hypothetical protein